MKYGHSKTSSPEKKRLVTKLAKYESSILKPREESEKKTTTKKKNSTSETSFKSHDQSNKDLQLRLDARLAEIESLRSTISSLRVPTSVDNRESTTTTTRNNNNNNEVLNALSKEISTLQTSFDTSLTSLQSSHRDTMERERKRYEVYVGVRVYYHSLTTRKKKKHMTQVRETLQRYHIDSDLVSCER